MKTLQTSSREFLTLNPKSESETLNHTHEPTRAQVRPSGGISGKSHGVSHNLGCLERGYGVYLSLYRVYRV